MHAIEAMQARKAKQLLVDCHIDRKKFPVDRGLLWRNN